MANNNINSVNFLPEYLRTDKNTKFLSATLDQWMQPAQIERIDGFIGSKITPTYNSTSDIYLSESSTLRSEYQLLPALVVNDKLLNVQDVVSLDDLINEINIRGGNTTNLDRMFRPETYSYNPYIDWDKLINYRDYYWMVMGPDEIEMQETEFQITRKILNHVNYTSTATGLVFTNGLRLRFVNPEAGSYYDNDYFVEGVGTDQGIRLIKFQDLKTPEPIANLYNEKFDSEEFSLYNYDESALLPLVPEYITINRSSQDLNSWSRYNRWVHSEVIRITAEANGHLPVYNAAYRAQRPIIEFAADLKLFNYGSVGIPDIDFIDHTITEPSLLDGDVGYYIDQVLLQAGNTIVFNSAMTAKERSTIYRVKFIKSGKKAKLKLEKVGTVPTNAATAINFGAENHGTDWYFDGNKWKKSQQHTKLNQAPLFDLFTDQGISYADKTNPSFTSNFAGNKIFGYAEGTGTPDPYLGFPLKYKNSVQQGDYLFNNYFMTGVISITAGTQYVSTVSTALSYFKFSNLNYEDKYANVWSKTVDRRIPIVQFQTVKDSTSSIAVTIVDSPATNVDSYIAYVNNKQLEKSETFSTTVDGSYVINFAHQLAENTNVSIEVYSDAPAIGGGYYQVPLGLTNNPLNGPISSFTLSELAKHAKSITDNLPGFEGKFPGISNLRDLSNIAQYGTGLISNANPQSFAHLFIGKKEHNVITAISKAQENYEQFKSQLISQIGRLVDQTNPIGSLDLVLSIINQDKNNLSSYYLTDMLAYGTNKTVTTYTVTDHRITQYPISSEFVTTQLSLRSVLVYVNGIQLILNQNYTFNLHEPYVTIKSVIDNNTVRVGLREGDVITIVDYPDTTGSYIPPTPSKLGLYPSFYPKKYLDTTYGVPQMVIQGHDGSIIIAYNDYRDDILLEFEKRVYNNIKQTYRPELFDMNSVTPGAFRTTEYSIDEVTEILSSNFVKWAGHNGIDYTTNNLFDQENTRTWNYSGSYIPQLSQHVYGYWRSIFKYLYDTDRPDTHPWEMLGFGEEPEWWDDEYGNAEVTSNHLELWLDIEQGLIRRGPRAGVDQFYARPGLRDKGLIPVDQNGSLIDLTQSILTNITPHGVVQPWKFGDQAPAETAWRRSSSWPFAIQRLLALTKPASYSALMYDPSRVVKNKAGQWTYGIGENFFNPKVVSIHGEGNTLTSGYSVLVSEIGKQRTQNYIKELRNDISYLNFNLFYKVGGFVSKDKLQITIDAYEPNSNSPGALLPPEDYTLRLNVSNPIDSASLSGIVVQKSPNGKFIVKGYDTQDPYFTVYTPIRSSNTPSITVGGVSEPFVKWAPSVSGGGGSTGLTSVDTTTAASATGLFYQAGQIVYNNGTYYRVKVSHNGEGVFNSSFYQVLPFLPTTGGATAQIAEKFNKTAIEIPYGTEFNTVQEVYDFIVGYGAWLEDRGFVFDEYNSSVNDTINWEFSGKEFLYWTTQNWATNNIITLSPFADQIRYSHPAAVVDNLFDSFYDYSLLSADGLPFDRRNLFVNRKDGVCTISATTSTAGIYFARINAVQQEHAMVFNNTTIFNDLIYDIETGARQQRMKLSGFRTTNWDGDFTSPGFVYDNVSIADWLPNTYYQTASVIRYNGIYYSALGNVDASSTFDFSKWFALAKKPQGGLLSNFDYRINQFQDFYSLDIDNFDSGQQKAAQHLIGYTPRVYLNNIFTNPIAQYKFYQGFIREKGTRNAVQQLSKATIQNYQGTLDFTEEWAFRIGAYGSYSSFKEIEHSLIEGTFTENPQIVQYVDTAPTENTLVFYSTASNMTIVPVDYDPKNTFYTTTGTYHNNGYVLPLAGFVRYDDVTFSAYNENSLLDIANNHALTEGNTAWVGFKQSGDWDVLRYTLCPFSVVTAEINGYGDELIFTTTVDHNLTIGEIISLTQFTLQVNGVYIVKSIVGANQFSVSTSLIALDPLLIPGPGQLFKFVTARAATFDSLPDNTELAALAVNSLVWVDSDAADNTGSWVVYRKIKNYSPIRVSTSLSAIATSENEQTGYTISQIGKDNIFAVGSPKLKNHVQVQHLDRMFEYGGVTVYIKSAVSPNIRFKYFLNQNETYPYYDRLRSPVTDLGHAVVYDSTKYPNTNNGLIIAGAPKTSYVRTITNQSSRVNVATMSTTTEFSVFSEQGVITISAIDPLSNEELRLVTLVSPSPQHKEHFGSSLYVTLDSEFESKLLLVGAIGSVSSPGTVYAYNITTGTTVVNYLGTINPAALNALNQAGLKWGYSISGSDDGRVIAIGAPGYKNKTGMVEVFNGTQTQQIIYSPFAIGGEFGEKVKVSADGSYLIISAPTVYSYKDNNKSYGQVAIYTATSQGFVLESILKNPLVDSDLKFGHDISINASTNVLIISALGTDVITTSFDEVQTRTIGNKVVPATTSTVNDAGTTKFYTRVEKTGNVYVFNKLHNRFVFAEELPPYNPLEGANHGYSLQIDKDNTIYVGAPAIDNQAINSVFYQYNSTSTYSWEVFRHQEALVDINTVQRMALIDTFNEDVLSYLETIDPAKGKVSGMAEKELKYKSIFDPAVYTIGSSNTVVNPNTNWLDDHVGELWWDLSTVKYQWYEQGDLEFRKNNWGQIFPGSSIDVYEWVGTYLLPSQWASQADTIAGLTQGISGQPKFVDDSTVSAKQTYDPISDSFTNYYFYWVKNKITVPKLSPRTISSYQVASIIADPVAYGIQFVYPVRSDAIALANIGAVPVGKRINLNISMDQNPTNIPKHTEWVLLQENNATSQPTTLLEKKLIDSLIGHDSQGNIVPDPALSPRQRYGIEVRPRQSMFVDRFQALRNLIEFTNNILIDIPVTGNYSFVNLKTQEAPPTQYSNSYDQIVETLADVSAIDVRRLTLNTAAKITSTVYDGRVTQVDIINTGWGYINPPTITVVGNSIRPAVITTELDADGKIIAATIVDSGEGYAAAPELIVRPYTVIVMNDADVSNKWSEFAWDAYDKRWTRVHTQRYNTELYWNYVDYVSAEYNRFKLLDHTIDSVYELSTLKDLQPGQYIKIKNIGDNRSAIVSPTEPGMLGSFSSNYNLIWSEKGTIQLSESLWNIPESKLGFDEFNNFDQTLYNQAPDIELQYILTALKHDIFVNELKVNWNKFFFAAVKYALYEQKLLDWAFKTTFINVINYAGELDQRPIYKITTSTYFEQYIEEVKPYHTQIRNFITNQTAIENAGVYSTDFDLPAYYNKTDNLFELVSMEDPLMDTYPWKSWKDNYSYSIGQISIPHRGTGYIETPTITISPPDLPGGTTATVEAYIGAGQISYVKVINSGTGYLNIPTATVTGGGYTSKIANGTSTNILMCSFAFSEGDWIFFNQAAATNPGRFVNDGFYTVVSSVEVPNQHEITILPAELAGHAGNFAITLADSLGKLVTFDNATDLVGAQFEYVNNGHTVSARNINTATSAFGDFSTPAEWVIGQEVLYVPSNGIVVTGLIANTPYFITNIIPGHSGSSFQVASSRHNALNGIAIDLGNDQVSSAILNGTAPGPIQFWYGNEKFTFVENPVMATVTTPATLYVHLSNNTVRKNSIDIKFDRVSLTPQFGNINVVDRFVCDGSQSEFVLSWVAQPDKQKITVTLNGDLVLLSDYTISYYTAKYNGYMKKYSKLVFLNYIPKADKILTIEYVKSTELMTAAERMNQFSPSSITSSTEIVLDEVKFDHTQSWAQPYPAYDEFAWADAVDNYFVTTVAGLSTVKQPQGHVQVEVNDVSGISQYQYANIISTATQLFKETTVVVDSVDGNIVTFRSDFIDPRTILEPGTVIEFWNNNTDFSILDTIVNGGAWSTSSSTTSHFMTAIGIDPNDIEVDSTTGLYYLGGISTLTNSIVVDADGFYTPSTDFSPEELVAGQTSDSLGINVYTRNTNGAPIVLNSYVITQPNETTTAQLSLIPPNIDSVSVVFNNNLFSYTDTPNWSGTVDKREFTIDWANNTVVVPPQSQDGILEYTIITIGSDQYVDTVYALTTSSEFQLRSPASIINSVKSVYVTVNGKSISTATSTVLPYYSLTAVDGKNNRAAVDIFNLPSGNHRLQAWFFDSAYKHFNEIKEQSFTYFKNQGDLTDDVLTLTQPPGLIGPAESNMIVEVTASNGDTRMLQSPFIAYYQVTNSLTFQIPLMFNTPTTLGAQKGIVNYIGQPPSFNSNTVKAFSNGIELRFGFDYTIQNDKVIISSGVVSGGDVVAVVSYNRDTSEGNFDYRVDGDKLTINNPQYSTGWYKRDRNGVGDTMTIKVITFTNQDTAMMQVETFAGNTSGQYKISRPVIDNNYLWINFNNSETKENLMLMNRVDFVVLSDQVTIQISDKFTTKIADIINANAKANASGNPTTITITSVSSTDLAVTLLGYRIFTDMFNRTQFKRLSKNNTTRLARPLHFYDTEIYVDDATVLSQPIISKKIPGVVSISGERIEFFKVSGNVLSQLRRSTLGTAPCFYNDVYTKVIDQGIDQTVPYAENIYKQSYISVGTTNTFTISHTPETVYYNTTVTQVSNSTTAILTSDTPYSSDLLLYVSINGEPTTSTYMVAGNDSNTVINVYNLAPTVSYVIQAWVVGSGNVGASQVPYYFTNQGITLQTNPTVVTTTSYKISNIGTTSTIKLKTLPVGKDSILVMLTTGTDWSTSTQLTYHVDSQWETTSTQFTVDWNTRELIVSPQAYTATIQYTVVSEITDNNVPLKDQVSVYYGGRLLRKTGAFVQDTTISYDGPTVSYTTGSVATVFDLPVTNVKGTAYITTDTNHVWVYTNANTVDSISGYVYNGLNYLPPEFDIAIEPPKVISVNPPVAHVVSIVTTATLTPSIDITTGYTWTDATGITVQDTSNLTNSDQFASLEPFYHTWVQQGTGTYIIVPGSFSKTPAASDLLNTFTSTQAFYLTPDISTSTSLIVELAAAHLNTSTEVPLYFEIERSDGVKAVYKVKIDMPLDKYAYNPTELSDAPGSYDFSYFNRINVEYIWSSNPDAIIWNTSTTIVSLKLGTAIETTTATRIDAYLPPPVTVLYPITQKITLNIPEALEFHLPTRLDVVKRQFIANKGWNDPDPANIGHTLSIMQSTSTQARFLQNQPAELPYGYYYGGDRDLYNSNGITSTNSSTDFTLTINNDPLTGY